MIKAVVCLSDISNSVKQIRLYNNVDIEGDRLHPQEDEADEFARNLLIPAGEWERIRDQAASISRQEVLAMADRLQVSPAIVAGRIRWALGDFSRFSDLIGNKKVKRLFDEEG
jgi:HTH-type transcriptional regulator / antitoxin HigA